MFNSYIHYTYSESLYYQEHIVCVLMPKTHRKKGMKYIELQLNRTMNIHVFIILCCVEYQKLLFLDFLF